MAVGECRGTSVAMTIQDTDVHGTQSSPSPRDTRRQLNFVQNAAREMTNVRSLLKPTEIVCVQGRDERESVVCALSS